MTARFLNFTPRRPLSKIRPEFLATTEFPTPTKLVLDPFSRCTTAFRRLISIREFTLSRNLTLGAADPIHRMFLDRRSFEHETARILPDGCADILFVSHNGQITTQIVGVMTRPRLVPLPAGTSILGIRFHPGMAGACLGIPIAPLNDRTLEIQSAMGSAANNIVKAGATRTSIERRIAAIEDQLIDLPAISSIQSAIGELTGRKGQLSTHDFAAAAGVSERQLRRTCLKYSGLAPKLLARILRFRNAATRLRSAFTSTTTIAHDCGYFDQAHLIRDFKEFAAMTPIQYSRHHA